MKKTPVILTSVLLLAAFFAFSVNNVQAEEATSTGIKRLLPAVIREKLDARQEKKAEILETRKEKKAEVKEKIEEKREDKQERVRKAVTARWNVFSKLTEKAEALLTKLQERIDTAKSAGKDVKDAETVMTDARAKLTDAKIKASEIEEVKGTAMNREVFKEIQLKFQAIHKDLNALRQDASKIIRTLKSFNSENPKATTSATDKD